MVDGAGPDPVPSASVVVPAHDEARVLARCLNGLLRDARPGELDIVVVANGCRDGTAAIARQFAPAVRVVELETASKAAALNAGDDAAGTFPRLYVDADVETSTRAVREVIRLLDTARPVIATPRRRLELAGAGALVRAYYRTWEALQRARGETIGSGVYALNEPGRARFASFPDAVGDDTFVHALFSPDERRVGEHEVTVRVPTRLGELVRVRTRVYVGNMQHRQAAPVARSQRPSASRQLRSLARQPGAVLALPVYAAVTGVIKARARRRLRAGDRTWTRAAR